MEPGSPARAALRWWFRVARRSGHQRSFEQEQTEGREGGKQMAGAKPAPPDEAACTESGGFPLPQKAAERLRRPAAPKPLRIASVRSGSNLQRSSVSFRCIRGSLSSRVFSAISAFLAAKSIRGLWIEPVPGPPPLRPLCLKSENRSASRPQRRRSGRNGHEGRPYRKRAFSGWVSAISAFFAVKSSPLPKGLNGCAVQLRSRCPAFMQREASPRAVPTRRCGLKHRTTFLADLPLRGVTPVGAPLGCETRRDPVSRFSHDRTFSPAA